ncbi:MAG: hypothetical protein KJO49_10855 [Bacteroidia bacterium]|nr:hypothetical protein [Bacteroidia bacterium]MBT8268325.1 hypothetical protein [Bacteroidia bacterium]NNF83096.1 hypothetical protein [Flavobacteriaceae bacterium]NNK69019.1 hypothetical protein [Flavobacteriaceae bacterium]NNL81604.1 hypothetical protein [Flavobacteriaceae bacterium]
MKAATISEIKKELKFKTNQELIDYCLKMARFKLESKELLTYLVFESENEDRYVSGVQDYISNEFDTISATNYYYIKKTVRKILRQTKRYIRYSKNKESEAILLMHFCKQMLMVRPQIRHNRVLSNMYNKQLELAGKAISTLHEDLQYDLFQDLEELATLSSDTS